MVEQAKIRQRQQFITGGALMAVVVIVAFIIITNLPHNTSTPPKSSVAGAGGSTAACKFSAIAVGPGVATNSTFGLLSDFAHGTTKNIAGTYTVHTLSDGVQYADLQVGTGKQLQGGETVTVNYVGWLTNGLKFDASADHGGPQQFALTSVITGWGEGMVGMKVCGERRLYIPAAEGYGTSGNGPVPANAILIFDVQLVSTP